VPSRYTWFFARIVAKCVRNVRCVIFFSRFVKHSNVNAGLVMDITPVCADRLNIK
jgi:hypothetical protein